VSFKRAKHYGLPERLPIARYQGGPYADHPTIRILLIDYFRVLLYLSPLVSVTVLGLSNIALLLLRLVLCLLYLLQISACELENAFYLAWRCNEGLLIIRFRDLLILELEFP
jgi:hypothetical protein